VLTNPVGNELFKQKKYHEAAVHYTQAMKMNPKDPRVSIFGYSPVFPSQIKRTRYS
jgi:stress-induced-phosphoprotein 1